MNEIMSKEVRMTSVEVCEMINQFREIEDNKAQLRHDNLMSKIKKEIEQSKQFGVNALNIQEVKYEDSKGEMRPCYSLDRDTIISLTVTESFIVRRKMIEYINKLEKELKSTRLPQTYKEALLALVQNIEEKEKLEQENKLLLKDNTEMQPKAEFYDAVTGSSDTLDMGQVAKLINIKGIGRNKMFEILRDKKVLMSNNVPYQSYIDKGWFRLVESKFQKPNGDTCINIKTVVFQKGVDGISNICKEYMATL